MAILIGRAESAAKSPGKLRTAVSVLALSVVAIVFGGGAGYLMIGSLNEQAVQKYKAEVEAKAAPKGAYAGEIELQRIQPVVTNLANSKDDWIRLEVALIFPKDKPKDTDVLIAEYRQDLLGFLRTMSIAQIQGPSGLVHLREDINDRARIRFDGAIKEVIIESLIIQ